MNKLGASPFKNLHENVWSRIVGRIHPVIKKKFMFNVTHENLQILLLEGKFHDIYNIFFLLLRLKN